MLGHRDLIHPWGIRHRDTPLPGSLKVNPIHPDPIFADNLQPRQGLLDHPWGNFIIPTDDAIHIAH